jgi:CRISPR/Cas system CSM-associated protein Csm2 small subunit/Zn finger protein HypA/HybF involved in hydrogenase expression
MPDMKDALNKAGIKSQSTEVKCRECGKPFEPREPHHKLCEECMKKGAAKGAAGRSGETPSLPDMKDAQDAQNRAGTKSQSTEVKCRECGKPFQPRERHHKLCADCVKKGASKGAETAGGKSAFQKAGTMSRSQENKRTSFDEGYPDYFDTDGLLKPEFVTTLAEEIAGTLGNQSPKMTMHQLRAFYSHVKLQEGALKANRPFKAVSVEIAKLKPFASERASKGKVPRYFEDFIVRNVDKVKDKDTFLNGFVEHFQAVVAYCAGTLERRRS